MPGNRWESSKRPLFIRTVWKDGHHHVLFKKEDETRTRARKNPGTARRHPDLSTPQVPPVTLFLSGLRSFSEHAKIRKSAKTDRKFAKSALTVDVIPGDSVRFSDLNKQVFFQNEKKIHFKAKSLEVERENLETPPPFSYENFCMDQFNTTLSERVIIWLDLAVQNNKVIKILPPKKLEKTETVPVKKVAPLVTSRMECERVEQPPVVEEVPKIRPHTAAKRQLHIFLPNLPKKSSESGSSKSSSLFQKCDR
ncbi:hypothetical protein TcasGA2_TC004056 [Tribolium castaneum]|uniref:Uncharacterized protein n=1 Tax=Tribolium castaneum TaxID=7070 RepID=D7EIG3_TRICA|nr:hypothetical protein TcasGA2_TC004056 [Tribolium castaneum]